MNNLLLVEDEPTQLLLTQRMLRRGGYEVETASDGAAALEKLATGHFSSWLPTGKCRGWTDPRCVARHARCVCPDICTCCC